MKTSDPTIRLSFLSHILRILKHSEKNHFKVDHFLKDDSTESYLRVSTIYPTVAENNTQPHEVAL